MNSILLCFILIFSTRTARATFPLIEESLQKYVQEQVSKECETCKVKIFFRDKLEETLASDLKIESVKNIQVANLKGETTIYFETEDKNYQISADLRWYDNVVIADSNVSHGTILSDRDLKLVEKDITFNTVHYLQDVNNANGMVVRRSFQRGHIIDENFLKRPNVVKYGQPLKLILDNGQLSMSVSAKARGAGAVGDVIPVLIGRTNKKVMAQIVDSATARME